jgi:hypothetical protein
VLCALVEELGGAQTGEVHTGPEGLDVVMTDPEGTEFCLVALPATEAKGLALTPRVDPPAIPAAAR